MKRLVAYVRRLGDGLTPEWLGHVEIRLDASTVDKRKVEGASCIEAMERCEEVAFQHGFALDWQGFVGRAVQVDREGDGEGAQPA